MAADEANTSDADVATVPAKAEPSRLIGCTCGRTDASRPPVASWSHHA